MGCGFQSFFAFAHNRTLHSLTCICNITSCATSVMLLLWRRVFSIQRIILLHSKILSGVSQVSVLDPINDIANCISGRSKINLFADDIALYRIITNHDDFSALQSDVNSCLSAKHLTLSFISWQRVHSILPPCLSLGHSPLAQVSSYKYLGLLITTDLIILLWSTHIIASICTKMRKPIAILHNVISRPSAVRKPPFFGF